MQKNWQKSLRKNIVKKLKKYNNKKKKRTKRYSQENYQRGLQQKYYGDSLTKSMRDKGKKDRRKAEDNGKISQNEKT